MATNPSNANTTLTIQSAPALDAATQDAAVQSPERRDALQALLAFSTLHEQIRRRRAEEARRYAEGVGAGDRDWEFEQFVLDEVLQLVAERAQAITGASGIAIALAEGDEIICRASVGSMAPDRGMRLDAKAGFSGACFRSGRIVRCDDSEKDARVNLEACRRLGTRSMVAVPLQGQESVVGLLEAFSKVFGTLQQISFKWDDECRGYLPHRRDVGYLQPEMPQCESCIQTSLINRITMPRNIPGRHCIECQIETRTMRMDGSKDYFPPRRAAQSLLNWSTLT